MLFLARAVVQERGWFWFRGGKLKALLAIQGFAPTDGLGFRFGAKLFFTPTFFDGRFGI